MVRANEIAIANERGNVRLMTRSDAEDRAWEFFIIPQQKPTTRIAVVRLDNRAAVLGGVAVAVPNVMAVGSHAAGVVAVHADNAERHGGILQPRNAFDGGVVLSVRHLKAFLEHIYLCVCSVSIHLLHLDIHQGSIKEESLDTTRIVTQYGIFCLGIVATLKPKNVRKCVAVVVENGNATRYERDAIVIKKLILWECNLHSTSPLRLPP